MSTQETETEPVPALHEVSLAQYAAVQAGLAEGIDLEIVLENEQIAPATWLDAEDAWSDRLLDDLEQDGPLQPAFDEHLAEAQARYGRRVPPLDESLDAWLDFVRHWSAAAEPVAFLARLELRASDIIRLHRTWSQRMAIDPALAQQAQDILLREPGELCNPRPAACALERAPRAPAVAPSIVEDAPRDDGEPGVFVDLAAWLAAESPATPADSVAVEVPSAEPRAPDLETTVLPTASPLRRAGIVPSPAARARAEPPKPPSSPVAPPAHAVAPPSSAAPEHDPAASTTAPIQPGIFNNAVLPFKHGAPSITEMAPPAAAVSRPRPGDFGATGVMPEGLLAAALPFMHGAAPAPLAADKPVKTPVDLGATGIVPAGPIAAAMPFSKGAAIAPVIPAVDRRPTVDLGTTAVVAQGPIAPAIPFAPPVAAAPAVAIAPPVPAAPAVAAAPLAAKKSPGPAHDFGATGVMPTGLLAAALPFMRTARPGGDPPGGGKDSLSKRVTVSQPTPFAVPVAPAPRAALAPVVAPTPGAAPAPVVAPAPAVAQAPVIAPAPTVASAPVVAPAPESEPVPLTLAQYASLCAELTVFPAATEQTFLRYGLAAPARRVAIDLKWQERLRRSPADYTEWQRLYQHYQTYFRSAGR